MRGHPRKRLLQQRAIFRIIQPRRSSRRMREDDDIELAAGPLSTMPPPHHTSQLRLSDQLLRGERADSDDKLRTQKANLAIEMRAAVGDFGRIRDAIAASLQISSGKTANDSAHVDTAAKGRFVDAELLEPTEQTLTFGVRERAAILHFLRTRSLADAHHPRVCDRAGPQPP